MSASGSPREQFISHISDDGRVEAVEDHLREVSEMAAEFAKPFGAENYAAFIGSLHDIGKFSREFQRRILDGGPKVDHSTAGAHEALSAGKGAGIASLLAYCIAGHHGGLPNGGHRGDDSSKGTLYAKLTRAERRAIPDYSSWNSGKTLTFPPSPKLSIGGTLEEQRFTLSFFTRMLFSCLVDADYLCTERFMDGKARMELSKAPVEELRDLLEQKLATFYPPKSTLNKIRCEVLNACRDAANFPAGVFSLTVPTGGGKTYASMRFALNHACASGNSMKRIIYAIPYTSIIEQNAKVFRDVFGDENVLEHHANFDFSDEDDGLGERLRLASENWDAPIVVTTNVQLFESLFASKTSRCRKLHNIAGSVIVLDEAQMLPTRQLKPCIAALEELVRNYNCSVVMCTATQPCLDTLFSEETLIKEIIPDREKLYRDLSRVSYRYDGCLTDNEISESLAGERQVLCVTNSRKQTRSLYDKLVDRGYEGVFHLSTFMHSVHRSRIIAQIRERLANGKPCRVVSTSLVEAGVDLDFPTVFRALAGIDSIVQCAGRCNREGKHDPQKSVVHVFTPKDTYSLPHDTENRASVSRSVVKELRQTDVREGLLDLGNLDTVGSYFAALLDSRKENLDHDKVFARLSDYEFLDNSSFLSIPFKSASEKFHLIEDGSFPIIVPDAEIEKDIDALVHGAANRDAMRRISRHTVGAYANTVDELLSAGAIKEIDVEMYLLLDESLYHEETGLESKAEEGKGVFL